MGNKEVFVSYAHEDAERVEKIIKKNKVLSAGMLLAMLEREGMQKLFAKVLKTARFFY